VKVGDLVQVKVISVEVETKRIGLSMKALLPAVPRRRKKPRRRNADSAPPAPVTAEAQPGAAVAAAAGMMAAEDPPEGATQAQPARPRRPDSGDPRQRRRDYPRRDDFSRRSDPSRGNSQSRRDDAGRRDEYSRRSEAQPRKPAPPPPPLPEIEPEPKGPEPTLQEKIAIRSPNSGGIQWWAVNLRMMSFPPVAPGQPSESFPIHLLFRLKKEKLSALEAASIGSRSGLVDKIFDEAELGQSPILGRPTNTTSMLARPAIGPTRYRHCGISDRWDHNGDHAADHSAGQSDQAADHAGRV
jgi:hypothetical protein